MSEATIAAPVAPTATTTIDQSAPATIPIENPGRTFNATILALANKTGVEAAPAVETPQVKFVRDPQKVETDAPGSKDAPPGSAPPVDAAAAPVASTEPTEPTSELSIDDGEVTLSSQRNPDGTFKTKLDPNEKVDLVIKSITDPTTGKPRVYSKSLPELARLAKDGITLQQTVQKVQGELQTIQPEVEYYRTNVEGWKQRTETLSSELEAMRALNVELLTADDERVIQRREQYKAEMSPEKQLERLQAERAAEKAEAGKKVQAEQAAARRTQHEKIATSFVQSRIAPSLAQAQAAGLSKYEVTGLVTEITADLMQGGVIPPAAWPEMERRINAPDGPFQLAVKAESARRNTESETVKVAREAAEAAQRKAQAVVNTDGRLMAPIGRAGGESAPQTPKANRTVDQVKKDLIGRPLPQSMTGSG